MAYTREEQETTLVFDGLTGEWSAYSTVPKHMRRLAELTQITVLEYDVDGTAPKAVRGTLTDKQVAMKKERVYTEEQRAKMAERARRVFGSETP